MTISLGQSQTITGTWKVISIGVGPGQGDTGWWGLSVNSGDRACFFDDLYKFNANGTFQNVQGSETWIEVWQGGSDSCGTPAAPHNGSNAATYTSTASSLTLNGVGAYLGLAKVINGAEISNSSNAPASITYQISSLTSTTLTVDISVGGGWWRYVLAKQVENAPVLSSFSIPSKSVGSAAFTITPPTSNSTGAFTYTSSDTSVATVSGSTITVVGVGSTTITATQAASGSFASGTITAILDVTPSAAPNPTISSYNIIGLFTDAYPLDDVLIDMSTFLTSWSAASLTNIQIGSNNILKYSNVSYLGIEPAAPVDASAMNLFHLDLYTTNMTAFRVKLVDFGANGVYGGGDDTEHEVSMTPTLNGWNSYNLLLSSFTNMTAKAHIGQIVLSGNPAGSGLMFIDNMYFGNQAITVAPLLSAFTIASKATGDADFAITAPTSTSTGAFTYTSSNTAVATIVNGNSIHIVGIGTTTITATQAAAGSYTSGSITTSFVVTLPVATAPTTAAPTPPSRNASDVVSIFSGAYSNATLSELPTDWSQLALSPFSVETIAGNATWKFGGEFLGMVTNYDNGIDLTQMTTMHIDYWTPDNKIMIAKIVNTTGPVTEGLTIVQDPVVTGTWRSVDIPMAQFGTSVNKSKITQILLDPQLGGSTVYVDNFYFYRPESSQPSPTITNFTVPNKVIGDAAFTLTAPTSNSTGAFTYASSNTAVATINGNTVTIVGAGSTIITATQAAAGAYGSGVITANFVVNASAATAPTTAAPTPPSRNAWDVVSVYSGAYSDISNTNFFPDWGQGTQYEVVQLSGNNTMRYSNLDYQGINLVPDGSAGINVSTMAKLHLDIWTPNVSPIAISLIAGGENAVTLTPSLSGWNSFDINLSNYSSAGRTLNNVIQIKLEKPGFVYHGESNSVYIDNMYFWRPATSLPAPTLSGFAVAPKLVGDATFTLTAPTSNSIGAFTYASSNTAVATISGSTVTIVGAGSTIITATQAAAGSFGEGVITTNFIVSFPPPPTAAPTPTVPADRVLSLYSNAYTNVSGTDWAPNWGQSTQVSNIQIEGNDTKKYESMNYQGVQLANPIDVSSMTSLHVDIWTPNCTTFEVFLVNQALPAGQVGFSGEQAVSLSPTQSGWNSFDIPLASYSSLELNHIQQLKLVATPFGTTTAYLDNIYFTKPTPTVVAPTVTSVVNLCKGATATPMTASGHTGNTLKWYTVGGTTAVPTYTLIATGAPSPATTTVASPSKVYAVSEVYSNNVESAKVKITVNVLALPTTPSTLTGTAAQGILVGTTTTATYSTTDVVGASSYLWSVPTGVNIISGQGTTSLVVNFNNVAAGAGAIGTISVQSVNSSGCNSVAKTLALTKALPAASTTLVMTDGVTTTAITNISMYAGTSTALTLTAGVSALATSYVWTLPTGVNVVSGNAASDRVITVKFDGVSGPCSISVNAKNGVGSSSTAKTLALTATIPAASTTLVMTNGVTTTAISNISIYAGTSTALTLTAGVSALATSYVWTLPTGVNVVSGNAASDRVITVKFDGVSGPCSVSVNAKNGVGSSLTAKTLALAATVPAVSSTLVLTDGLTTTAITNISKYTAANTALTLTAGVSALATSYEWTLPTGVNVVSGNPLADRVITVKFNGVSGPCSISVNAKNGVGSSLTAKTLALAATVPTAVSTVSGQITGICSSTTITYTITASALANSYRISAPANSVVKSAANTSNSSNILTTSDLIFTVTYPAGFVVTTSTLAANKTIVITSINGVGNSTTNKTLTLTSGNCKVEKVINDVVKTEIKLYPNPAIDIVNIEMYSTSASELEITVFSMNGSIVRTNNVHLTEGNNVINEDISSLESGIYFVRFNNPSNNEIITKKLIKQ